MDMHETALSQEAVYSDFADDPDFDELLQYFVQTIPEKRSVLERSYQERDLQQLAWQSHQLKGVGGGYGFCGLSAAAAELESACQANDAELVGQAVERLVGYLARITV